MRLPDQPRQAWVDFLNADSRARQGWCEQRGREAVRSDVSLQAFVQEIDGLLETPCE
jgi:hypothetical protein